MSHVFATSATEEEEIYPVTVKEIADAQRKDPTMKHIFNRPGKDQRNQKMIGPRGPDQNGAQR
eukprot:scaffold31381_cov73-Skeletonema_marinoi.AAC.1